MNVLKLLLYPFAAIYNGVMRIRNHLYDSGQKPTFSFETAVISVGNLNVGGSGKTPMVEYLINLLGSRFPTVTLSRGYRRETTGYRIAGSEDTARSIGDEPLQMFRKFGDLVHVAVGEDRVFAIPNILHEFPDTRVLLLDDALQQRSIKPNLSILLTSADRPFYGDYLLPFGRLRESRSGARRADVVVVTKCSEDLEESVQGEMTKRIRRYAGDKPVYFSKISYGELVPMRKGTPFSGEVILITGIANAGPIESYCAARFSLLHHFRFADHHKYTLANLQELDRFIRRHEKEVVLLTTEKDMAKLDCPEFEEFMARWKWFYLPIRQVFLKDGSKFDAMVLDTVQRAAQS
ncbi:MAG: tetraacyldisaccharide 4'-kinase [Cyclobacteriaceae bacterium]|nr:tetraacyldisaccharide 4'-kinase [Cyclobacteriaceae bacterium]